MTNYSEIQARLLLDDGLGLAELQMNMTILIEVFISWSGKKKAATNEIGGRLTVSLAKEVGL